MKKEKEKGEKSPKVKDAAVAEKTRSNSNADAAPSFSDAMVANLTKRIEQKLKGDESGNKALSKVDKKQKPEKNEKRKGRETDNEMKHTDKPAKKREPIADINATDKAGKKRDRSGKIIKPQVAEKPYSPEKKQGADGKNWEEEVYAIGGTKEDLDLVAGAESDSEMEDKEISSGDLERLRRDLGRLINGENELPDIEDTPAQGETKSAKAKQGKKQDKKPSGERLLEKPIQEEKSLGNAVSENTPVKRESKKVQKKDAMISETTVSTLEAKVPKKSSSSSSNLVSKPYRYGEIIILIPIRIDHSRSLGLVCYSTSGYLLRFQSPYKCFPTNT